ncbi:class I SAM-dependent methyltransferase [Mycolicibacterium mucogenicum]|uniref:class I SAM-dependent methyltransferase n=1 Tax=Mycolicibacterium TaxID=1866885 RepID=UPI00226A9ADD|nr:MULTISPECIES: class I SAM-dependent methyltransferase [Mycolicibacterium]MCX8560341.1 class I SAM-dependent methyltransferase [Mycolicibacterium mucogenicum]
MTVGRLTQALAPLIDIIFVPIVFVASLVMKLVRRFGIERLPRTRWLFRTVGIFPIRNHYYEPLFDTTALRRPLEEDRVLPGLDLNVSQQLDLLTKFSYGNELLAFPMDSQSESVFYYDNHVFGPADAEFLYSMIRYARPKRIIEIGSGQSTLMARHAIAANRAEEAAYSCRHVCIEPYEAGWLNELDVELVRTPVEQIDLDVFRELEEGDILFIDSSHMIRPQGDVLFEYLQILPVLQSGVFVHIHDIRTPKDYQQGWLSREVRFWNEQYLVEAFLCFNHEYKIIGALNFLKHHHPQELSSSCPVFGKRTDLWEPGSLWIQRS